MKVVYKYVLAVEGQQIIETFRGAEILTVAAQGENVCVWALVDTEAGPLRREVFVVPTGRNPNNFPLDRLRYEGTAFLGALVFHVFSGLSQEGAGT